jgi:nucleoside-diphosphate-sugar epimerase
VGTDSPVLVTGGTGFLGRRLVERLLAQGRPVTVLARRSAPDLAARGVRFVAASIEDADAVRAACAGMETVFHVAARVGIWGRYDDFFRANVLGTRAILAGCREHGVARLVHTSTPSVVYNGRPLSGADESLPLTTDCPAAYPLTKAIAEREVLAANSPALRTIALRPHLIWGVGDPHLVPRILARARAGRLRIVGDGKNRVDMVHVENAVDAHLLAEAALAHPLSAAPRQAPDGSPQISLRQGSPPPRVGAASNNAKTPLPDHHAAPPPDHAAPADDSAPHEARPELAARTAVPACSGRAYFITNDEPVLLWDWINALLTALGEPPVTRRIPLGVASAIGAACEAAWRVLPLRGEPPMTRFVAAELAKDHWFDVRAARRDLGYTPRISMRAGTAELVAALKRTG